MKPTDVDGLTAGRGDGCYLPGHHLPRGVVARILLLFIGLLGLLIFVPAGVRAADISLMRVEKDKYGGKTLHVLLKGPITVGDYSKLRTVLPDEDYQGLGAFARLHLNSRGGAYTEGLKIARFLLDASIGTDIDAGNICFSACAIIFMAGNYAGGNAGIKQADRVLNIKGQLGFHAPFLKDSSQNEASVAKAYRAAIQSINALIRMANTFDYHGAKIIKPGLITEMLARAPGELFLIDTVDKVGRWDILLGGVAEPKRMSRKQLNQACDNLLAWRKDESSLDYDFTNGGAFDGLKSDRKLVDVLGEPGERVVIEFGLSVKFYCQLDFDKDKRFIAANIFYTSIPADDMFPGDSTIVEPSAWYGEPPSRPIAELAAR